MLPVLKQTDKLTGEFRIAYDRYLPTPSDICMATLGSWLYQKSFELYSVGFQPPDDLMVIMGQNMHHILFKGREKDYVERHGHRECVYNLPARIVLPKLSDTIPQFAGTPIDRANSITVLYLPWVQGWCFCTIPECAPNNLQLEDGTKTTEAKTIDIDSSTAAAERNPTVDVEPNHGHRASKVGDNVGCAERGQVERAYSAGSGKAVAHEDQETCRTGRKSLPGPRRTSARGD